MSPLEEPTKELDEKFIDAIGKFVANVKNGKIDGSYNIAMETVTLLEQIISDSDNATAYELCSTLHEVGRQLSGALPLHLVATNMVRRVLRAVRDETRAAANQSGEGAGESLQRLVLATPSRRATFGPEHQDLREPLRDHIAELRAELESSRSSVCAQARGLVRAGLVLAGGAGGAGGAGALLEAFLRAAHSAHAAYTLLLAESADVRESHAMASRLSAAGVSVTVIPAAAVYAVMSRVNKVVVSVCAALGGGAALAPAGLLALTAAARFHNVPVLSLAPLHVLAPLHASERAPHHEPRAPHHALPYESCCSVSARVLSPRYDFLPPDHTTLFITNLGGSSPSYMYRLMSELYDPKDYHL